MRKFCGIIFLAIIIGFSACKQEPQKPKRLSKAERKRIISFLNTLNDEAFDKSEPVAVPSGLPVGGNIH